jgi:hypothetical protein
MMNNYPLAGLMAIALNPIIDMETASRHVEALCEIMNRRKNLPFLVGESMKNYCEYVERYLNTKDELYLKKALEIFYHYLDRKD